jgi:hypothetical protein
LYLAGYQISKKAGLSGRPDTGYKKRPDYPAGRIPDIKKGQIIRPAGYRISEKAGLSGRPDIRCISVVDPKLFFSDPGPIFVRVLNPDSYPDPL